MESIAILDFITVGVLLIALITLVFRRQPIPLQRSTRFVLIGFVLLLLAFHFSLFMEWRQSAGSERFDRLENFLGTLTPMVWFLVFYSLVKEVSIRELQASERKLRHFEQIVSHTGDLLALVDDQYIFQAVSHSYINFFSQSAVLLIGKQMAAVEGRDHFLQISKPMADRCLAGEQVCFQTWLSLPNGENRYLDTHYYPYVDSEKGKITGFIISARDVTTNKKLEQQLHQASKMEAVGTLAGGIAHDFNNILSAMIGYAELALLPGESREAVARYMLEIQKSGQRAADLVKQILTFSRLNRQEIKPLLLKPMIKEALKFIRASLPANIEIKEQLISNSYVLADPTQIHQIIMNLSTNAAYAMRESGGILKVKLQDCTLNAAEASHHMELGPGDYVSISVTDTGGGIPVHVIDRIFDPFFTTKPKDEGTGMGLSVVHGIVQVSHGAIAVDSLPGRGTTFHILLPQIPHCDPGLTMNKESGDPRGCERILFVDDEVSIAEIGKKTLEGLGYRVTAINSSTDALALFRKDSWTFDLVMTDLAMPGLTGDRLAAAILNIRPDIPIIIATGFSQVLSEAELSALGIRKIVSKPLLKKELAAAVREVLDA